MHHPCPVANSQAWLTFKPGTPGEPERKISVKECCSFRELETWKLAQLRSHLISQQATDFIFCIVDMLFNYKLNTHWLLKIHTQQKSINSGKLLFGQPSFLSNSPGIALLAVWCVLFWALSRAHEQKHTDTHTSRAFVLFILARVLESTFVPPSCSALMYFVIPYWWIFGLSPLIWSFSKYLLSIY